MVARKRKERAVNTPEQKAFHVYKPIVLAMKAQSNVLCSYY
jgi:hypothetical protein